MEAYENLRQNVLKSPDKNAFGKTVFLNQGMFTWFRLISFEDRFTKNQTEVSSKENSTEWGKCDLISLLTNMLLPIVEKVYI